MTEPNTKPMNQTERRHLIQLIKNDYGLALAQLGANEAEFVADRSKQIRDKYADEQRLVDDARAEVRELQEKLIRQWEDLRANLGARGMTFQERNNNGWEVKAKIELPAGHLVLTAKERELTQLRDDAKRARNRAEAALRDGQSSAERAVLLTAIQSPEAKEMLESIPKAEAVFKEAIGGLPPKPELTGG